jgi:hypothetical protein
VAREERTGDPGALMKPTSGSSTQEVLAGLVERVTFHNAENGFCVLRSKARGHHCREGRKRLQSNWRRSDGRAHRRSFQIGGPACGNPEGIWLFRILPRRFIAVRTPSVKADLRGWLPLTDEVFKVPLLFAFVPTRGMPAGLTRAGPATVQRETVKADGKTINVG